jgi:hypothetical protein
LPMQINLIQSGDRTWIPWARNSLCRRISNQFGCEKSEKNDGNNDWHHKFRFDFETATVIWTAGSRGSCCRIGW